MNRYLKIVLGSILVELILAVITFMGYISYSLTRVVRTPVKESPADLGLEYEDVSFPSHKDHLTIRGWYLPGGKEDRCIIMVHGGERHRGDPFIGMLNIAQRLVENNYSVLMFDMRARGESEGKRSSLGYYERYDLKGAINYVIERGISTPRIGILGFSMGAAVALLVVAEDFPNLPVVADSSYADLPELVMDEASKRIDLPRFFNLGWIYMSRLMYGVELNALRPVEAVHKLAPHRLLLIHGEEDEAIPVRHAYRLLAASHNASQNLWVVPEAGHAKSFRRRPDEYISRVVSFFDANLS